MPEFDPIRVEGLIRQIKDGREEFFSRIDPQIQQIVRKVCVQTKLWEHYEEVLGAVYEKVVHGFEHFEGSTWNELKTWLYKIANNAALDFITRTLGKMPPKTTLEDYDDIVDASNLRGAEKIHEHLDLIGFLETLEPMEGLILALYSAFEYTFDEIARIAKLPSYKARRMYIDVTKRYKKYQAGAQNL